MGPTGEKKRVLSPKNLSREENPPGLKGGTHPLNTKVNPSKGAV